MIYINVTTLLIVEMVFVGFVFILWSVGLIMMFMDNNKIKKRENVGLPKLEDFSSVPMPKCKPIKRPPSQFKENEDKRIDKMDREKIKEYSTILEQIEDLEGLVKAYESDTRTDWIASTKIRGRYGNTTSYEFDISRKESKERFLEWVKNEIKLLEELIK